jgi:nucleoside-diphosphate-sugar epimerase
MAQVGTRRVLVTGASGFIGGWIARGLHERGYAVRALYRRERPPARLAALAAAGVEVVRGDLTRDPDARAAVSAQEAVVHAAGLLDWGPAELFQRLNVEATARLLAEARADGCRVFLYIGSAAVHGFGPHHRSTEQGPYYAPVSAYQTSKRQAEEAVLAANAPGFRTTVLRPANVYGPGDTTTLYRMLAGQERGIRTTLGGGRRLTSVVYIEDLVRAVVLALESEAAAGQVFNITSGEQVSWGELMGYSASLLGVHPWFELPLPVAWVLAGLLSGSYRLLGIRRDPPLTPYRWAHVAHDFDFSIQKARRLLGYRPQVGWREGLRRTVEAYREDQRRARSQSRSRCQG